ncbi:MAG TPA: hypothetical protein VNQ76_09785, partial [Planctomicrobium sp.]|nr:hypothetical protein [Planctomicrobium sp.]
GTLLGGWSAWQMARQDRFPEATKFLVRAQVIAGVTTLIGLSLFLRWPFISESVSVPEEVTRTIVETVAVPVRVTRWVFFSETRTEIQEVPKDILETVLRVETRYRFSWMMFFLWGCFGGMNSILQAWIVRLAWIGMWSQDRDAREGP